MGFEPFFLENKPQSHLDFGLENDELKSIVYKLAGGAQGGSQFRVVGVVAGAEVLLFVKSYNQ